MKKYLRKEWPFMVIVLGLVIALMLLAKFVMPTFMIDSGSMKPVLPPGSIVVTFPDNNLQKQDIISFHAQGHVITHTFLGYKADGTVITKGDANPTPDVFDVPLQKSEIIGKVVVAITPLRTIIVLAILILLWVLWPSGTNEKKSEDETRADESQLTNPV